MTPLDYALEYAAAGLPVIPVKAASKVPKLAQWTQLASTDPDIVRPWWTRCPSDNVGVATGHEHPAGGRLVVLDVDEHDPAASGSEALADLSAELGTLPDTYTVLTPTGGQHLYYRTAVELTNAAGSNLPPGIDVRGAGGYVLAPPSTHPDGGQYTAELDHELADVAELPPAWVARLSAERERPTSSNSSNSSTTSTPAPRGALFGVDERPGDAWAAAVTWADLLSADGWEHDGPSGDGGDAWIRPGKTRRDGAGATVGYRGSDILKVFTSSAPPLEADETYTKLGYLATTKFHGDYTAAVDHLRTLGYGAPRKAPTTPTATTRPETEHRAADPAAEWDQPTPIAENHRPPFPLDALPPWIAAQAEQAAVEMQLTPDLAAQLAITALSVVTAGRVDVKVRGPWHEPTNTYTVTALPPSAGKSPTFAMMLGPLDRWEEELADAGESKAAHRDIERKIAEKQRDDAIKRGDAGEAKAAQIELDELPALVPPRLMADDATPEKLVDLLAQQGGRLALVSTEGGLFGMMTGRYSDKANLDVYLGAWSGDTIRVDRIERGSTVVRRPRLTVGLTVQPDVIARVGKNRELVGRGLTARFMYSVPADTVGARDLARQTTYSDRVAAGYSDGILELARRLDAYNDEPLALELSADAVDAYIAWKASREALLGPYGPMRYMAEWVTKCDSTVARLAALLHLAGGNHHDTVIDRYYVEQAIRVGDYWTEHARAAFDIMGASDDLGHARYVLGWLSHRSDQAAEVTFRDIHQGGAKRRVGTAHELAPALDMLVEYGWLRPLFDGPIVAHLGRGSKSPTFAIHPALLDPTSPHCPHSRADSDQTTADRRDVGTVRRVSLETPKDLSIYLRTSEAQDHPKPVLTVPTTHDHAHELDADTAYPF